jgi:DNA mismatch endonuclease (patch repair protein)
LFIEYIRDKRSPTPKSDAVSRVMSANRAKNGKPELLLRKALRHAGLRGYRLHYRVKLSEVRTPHSTIRNATVRPDISFVGKKLAIFVHGCFSK